MRLASVLALVAACVLIVALVLTAVVDEASVRTPTPHSPVTGARIAAAGDIACDPGSPRFGNGLGTGFDCRQLATSDLLVGGGYEAVLALGDIQYEVGAGDAFEASYDASWGRVKPMTRPVPGNHEYRTAGAAGYFQYFGAGAGDPTKGYYSYELGDWHVVALNSNCAARRWLRRRISAGALAPGRPRRPSVALHARVLAPSALLVGPARQRFDVRRVLASARTTPTQISCSSATTTTTSASRLRTRAVVAISPRGIREFVVGTGGKNLRPFTRVSPNSEARDATSLGVLELTLGANAYEWRFRAAVGSFTDSGSASCH